MRRFRLRLCLGLRLRRLAGPDATAYPSPWAWPACTALRGLALARAAHSHKSQMEIATDRRGCINQTTFTTSPPKPEQSE
eukprot:1092676-Prymnesium_polylepis.3